MFRHTGFGERHLRFMAVFAMLLQLLPALAAEQGVAMVTDVSGQVTGNVPVTITSEIPADARIRVETGGTLDVIYLQSGQEYEFSGPAQILFRATEPRVVSGAEPRKRTSPLAVGGNVKIRPLEVSQGGFVMRNLRRSGPRIRLLDLAGTRTLDIDPEFRWEASEANATYRFELADETGNSLYEVEVKDGVFKLPASVQLSEGVGYTWQLSARLGDGRRYVSAGDFSIATADLQARARALRPPAGAPVSERVAYAAWLEQAELRDEARKYWKALAAERPESTRLKALAGE